MEWRLPCPYCPSTDAYHIYDDGHGKCYSCSKMTFPKKGLDLAIPFDFNDYTREYLPLRGLTQETMRTYGIETYVDKEGVPRFAAFPYSGGASKIRDLGDKSFTSRGPIADAGLFGKDKFGPGSARSITVTEGELDAPSVYQMLSSERGIFPAVSVQSSVVAKRDCILDRDYLNSFEKIYLAFDNDTPGQKAVREVAQLFDFNKVYNVPLKLKDANDYLQAKEVRQFVSTWWNSRKFMPEGIHSSFADFDKILDDAKTKKGEAYPVAFETIQRMTDGLRTGEVVLFTALEGRGKTEVLRAIEHSLLKNTDHKVGIIHLEEPKARLLKGLAGLELRQAVHLSDSGVSNDDVKETLRRLSRTDDRIHVYSHFGSDDPNVILDTIRFLVASCGCRYIFLDHISMVVSGLQTDDERKALDYLSTRLAVMVNELDFGLCLVSHVNDDGLTRGSRNISKVCNIWIHLDRDIENENEFIRNITTVTFRKNRPTGMTGPGGKLQFNPETYTLSEFKKELPT